MQQVSSQKPVPIARVLHISDVHFGPRTFRAPLYRRLVQASFGNIGAAQAQKILKGLSPHDPTAISELEASLRQEAADPNWPAATLLVCTGDLATWGDAASIDHVSDMLGKIARETGLPAPTILYGNHDVWPEQPWKIAGFPLFASDATLGARRSRLRQRQFPDTWPVSHHSTGWVGPTQLAFYSLNTIVHEQSRNWRAVGEVGADRYWEGRKAPAQYDDLVGKLIGQGDIGVVFSHHPVHDPAVWPSTSALGGSVPPLMRGLVNAHSVAASLATANHHANAVNVVVSGHVHQIVPPINSLQLGNQHPLDPRQLQLCVGTAAQESPPGIDVEHSWQEIRFYVGNADLIVERIVYVRNNGIGEFQAVSSDTDPSAIGESVRIPL